MVSIQRFKSTCKESKLPHKVLIDGLNKNYKLTKLYKLY